MSQWYSQTAEEVLVSLGTSLRGLTPAEATARLARYGKNSFARKDSFSYLKVFLTQFESPLIYILLLSAVLIGYLGEFLDAGIVFIVLLVNAFIGAYQEAQAHSAYVGLNKLLATSSVVLRGGGEVVLPSELLVPGDVVILKEGERVPADGRLLENVGITLDESALTGESVTVLKTSAVLLGSELPLSDRSNMVWGSTVVVRGSGRFVITATGISSEVGKISERVASIDTEIPLAVDVRNLSRTLLLVVFAMLLVVFVVGVFRGLDIRSMLAVTVSLGVSVIPEGLPVVLTVVLVSGVVRMADKKVLVKRLQAVEALGQAQVLALDKTGTLTRNEMVVRELQTPHGKYQVSGEGYSPQGEVRWFSSAGALPEEQRYFQEATLLGKIGAFCSNASFSVEEKTHAYRVIGDPTEASLDVVGEKLGWSHVRVATEYVVVGEIPFSYEKKYHAVLRRKGTESFLSVVGAPDTVLPLLGVSKEVQKQVEALSEQGYRVLVGAYAENVATISEAEDLPTLTYAGLFAMRDMIRAEAFSAVASVKKAGIRVVMITGDSEITARAIAREAGIYEEGHRVISGQELEHLTDSELTDLFDTTTVFARVTPEHKLRIIDLYRKRGEVVAMTGDGVNDAPSLVSADLGVAMGAIGTEVAKDSADLVLLDDNFGNIVEAVHEGREIYRRIKRVLLYLFSTNLAEVLVVVGALVVGLGTPLFPVQIIWLNLITDGFLVIPLALDTRTKNSMRGSFTKQGRTLVDRDMAIRIVSMSTAMAISSLFLFAQYQALVPEKALTVSLTVLAVCQWFNALNCRHSTRSLFRGLYLTNHLKGAFAAVIALQILLVYAPPLAHLFRVVPLSLLDWVLIVITASSVVWVEEIRKWIARFYNSKQFLVE